MNPRKTPDAHGIFEHQPIQKKVMSGTLPSWLLPLLSEIWEREPVDRGVSSTCSRVDQPGSNSVYSYVILIISKCHIFIGTASLLLFAYFQSPGETACLPFSLPKRQSSPGKQRQKSVGMGARHLHDPASPCDFSKLEFLHLEKWRCYQLPWRALERFSKITQHLAMFMNELSAKCPVSSFHTFC